MIKKMTDLMIESKKNGEWTKANFLSTLISEIKMVGKNDGNRESTDKETISIVQKFLKNSKEMKKSCLILMQDKKDINLDKRLRTIEKEIDILEKFIPKQLTEDELRNEIGKIIIENDIKNMKGMGQVMKKLKESFSGRYDGKQASLLVKKIINEM